MKGILLWCLMGVCGLKNCSNFVCLVIDIYEFVFAHDP
jgi:hypothetical protein